jgi:hypothetical protein
MSSGITQSIDVATDPPGASCLVTRGREVLGVVAPTPGSLTIGKSSRTIHVDCTREGHEPASAVLDPRFQLMTAGNILTGGVIGLAVDAGTGAMHHYPGRVSLPMIPVSAPEPAVPPEGPRRG